MKIFESIRKDLVFLGVNPREWHPFNWKIAMGFLVFGLSTFFNAVLIFSIENNHQLNYVKIFGTITGIIQMGFCLLVIVLQEMKFLELIESIENVINGSMPRFALFWNKNNTQFN